MKHPLSVAVVVPLTRTRGVASEDVFILVLDQHLRAARGHRWWRRHDVGVRFSASESCERVRGPIEVRLRLRRLKNRRWWRSTQEGQVGWRTSEAVQWH